MVLFEKSMDIMLIIFSTYTLLYFKSQYFFYWNLNYMYKMENFTFLFKTQCIRWHSLKKLDVLSKTNNKEQE